MEQAMLEDLSFGELKVLGSEAVAAMSAAHARVLGVIAEVDRRGSFRDDGARSVSDWVVATFRVDRDTASAWVVAARRLSHLPAVTMAYRAGHMSFDQLEPAATMARPDTDAAWARDGAGKSPVELRRALSHQQASGVATAQDAYAQRAMRLVPTKDGSGHRISGFLPAELATQVTHELMRRAAEMGPNPETGRRDPIHARMADAFHQAVCGAPGRSATRPVVIATMNLDQTAASTTDGSALCLETASRLDCLCETYIAILDSDGEPMQMGRSRRDWSDAQKLWILARDGYQCVVEGCRSRTRLEVHHVRPFGEGGRTDTANGATLCYAHHHACHEGRFQLARGPGDQWALIRPDGQPAGPQQPGMTPSDAMQFLKDVADEMRGMWDGN